MRGEARGDSGSMRSHEKRDAATDTVIDFSAGCLGGITGLLAGHPFDTAKVRLQVQTTEKYYRGTFHSIKVIIQNEGIRGPYKGISSPLYGAAFINAIIFGVQGSVQRRLSNPTSITSHAVSGGVAGFAQCVVCSPMELAKIRLQMQGAVVAGRTGRTTNGVTYRGSINCLAKIYRAEGIRGIYCGMGFTILREVPSFMIYFAAYEYLQRLSRKRLGLLYDDHLPLWTLVICGGLTGVLTWLPTYPIDVIKTRIQSDITREYNGYVDCIRKMLARERCCGFTKGLGATIIRAFPTNAATLPTVTLVLRLLNPKETEEQRIATIERSGVTPQLE